MISLSWTLFSAKDSMCLKTLMLVDVRFNTYKLGRMIGAMKPTWQKEYVYCTTKYISSIEPSD